MKRVGLLLMASLLVTVVPVAAGSASDRFDDVASGHTFHDDIAWLAGSEITKGCNPPANSRFCPDDSVTRGQMAAFLVRALNLPDAEDQGLTDTASSVFKADIDALAAAGITKGCNPPANTRFCPTDPVTRGQMAAFLVRALSLPAAGDQGLTDTAGSVFKADIDALAAAGITKGCNPPANTRFCPSDPVTRGQMAAFLRRGLPDGSSGTLYGGVGPASRRLYRLDLGDPESDWEAISGGSAFNAHTVVVSRNELIEGYAFPGGNDNPTIQVKDLDTFRVTDSFVWDTPGWSFSMMAGSADGKYLAAIWEFGTNDTWIEVLRRSDRKVIGVGLDNVVTSLAWTPNNDLILTNDFSSAGNPDEWGGIGVIFSDSLDADNYWDVLRGYVRFTQTEGIPSSVDVAPDGSQLLYTLGGQVWVLDLTADTPPHQVTTGPNHSAGARFSPDGESIVFVVLSIADGFQRQYIVPNHRDDPILIELGGEYMIRESNQVVRIEGWRP